MKFFPLPAPMVLDEAAGAEVGNNGHQVTLDSRNGLFFAPAAAIVVPTAPMRAKLSAEGAREFGPGWSAAARGNAGNAEKE
jgi:hypothetical protein